MSDDERGYSVTVARCLGCGACTTVRNTPSTREANRHRDDTTKEK